MSFLKRLASFIVLLILVFVALVFITGTLALRRAERAAQAGEYRAAAEEYAAAARLLFWRADLLERAGLAAFQYQEYSTAAYYLERAPRLSARGLLALGYAYSALGDEQAAQAAFERGANLYASAPFYEALARTYRLKNNWEAERRALEKQIQLDAGNAFAHYRLAVLLSVLEPESALSEAMLAASLDRRFDPPVQTLRAALNLSAVEPDSSARMVFIGRALSLIEEWNLARAAFQKAVELDPQSAAARAWLGEAKQHGGEDSRADLDLALKLDPQSAMARGLSALYWERRGEYRRALNEYLLALQADPQNPVWHAFLAGAYAKSGDLTAALAAYQRATELEPDESAYWRELALFCAENGVNVEEIGLPAAEKAAQLAPDDPLALDALGYLYYVAGRYANAEKVLTDVAARFPQAFSAQIHLAMNYLAQGNHPAAYRVLRSVRDSDLEGADGATAETLLQKYFP